MTYSNFLNNFLKFCMNSAQFHSSIEPCEEEPKSSDLQVVPYLNFENAKKLEKYFIKVNQKINRKLYPKHESHITRSQNDTIQKELYLKNKTRKTCNQE